MTHTVSVGQADKYAAVAGAFGVREAGLTDAENGARAIVAVVSHGLHPYG